MMRDITQNVIAITVAVRLKGIWVERSRRLGDVYLALARWRGIGLEKLCERLLPAGQERIAWSKTAAVLVAARFWEPSSELHIAEDWYRRTALCDLLQLGDEEVRIGGIAASITCLGTRPRSKYICRSSGPSRKPPWPPAGSAVWGRPAAGALALEHLHD
jgi:hypothetical protein